MRTQANKQPLVNIVRQLMQESATTEAELARQTGLPQTTINRLLLGGTTDPRANTLKPIADFFSVTIGQLCGFEPLPTQRIAGTTNPTRAAAWRSIPIIEWDKIKSWIFERKKITPLNYKRWITSERDLSDEAFALQSLSSMEPRFRKGSILLVDPRVSYKDGHFVVVALDGIHPTVRKIAIDGSDVLLHGFNQTQAPVKLNKKYVIYGTIVESRVDVYDV